MSPQPENRKRQNIAIAIVLALTFLAYARSFANGYVYDDRFMVMAPNTVRAKNDLVLDSHPLSTYFTRNYGWPVAPTRGFRPVTMLSFRAVHATFSKSQDVVVPPEEIDVQGLCSPVPHHVVNVLLHVLATFFAFLLARPFVKNPLAAAGAAAVFGLHAIRSDSVTMMIGRGETMGFLFGAAASILLGHAACRPFGKSWWLALPVGACLFLAVGSKESALAWVAFAPLWSWAMLRRRSEPETAVAKQILPYAALAILPAVAIWALLYSNVLAGLAPFKPAFEANPLFDASIIERFPTAITLLGYGMYKVFAPFVLAYDYSVQVFPLPFGWGDYRFWAAFLVLAAALVGGLVSARRRPLLFLAIASFLGFSFVTSNILFGIEAMFAERFYYTPALGLSFLAAFGLDRTKGTGHKILLAVVATWLLASGYNCAHRSAVWTSNDTLYLHDVHNQPNSVQMQLNAARVFQKKLMKEQDPARRAEYEARRSEFLRQGYALDSECPEMGGQYAGMLMREDKNADAKAALEKILQAKHRHRSSGMKEVYHRLARLFDDEGDAARATDYYKKAFEREKKAKQSIDICAEHLDLLLRTGNFVGFRKLLASCREQFPGDPIWQMMDGNLAFFQKRYRDALRSYKPVLAGLEPRHSVLRARGRYALAVAVLGRKDLALKMLDRELKMGGLPPSIRRSLEAAKRTVRGQ